MRFEIVGPIEQVETIATGSGVKIQAFLRKVHGRGRWRKRKGNASQAVPRQAMRRVTKRFALCLDNTGSEASLILGKVYRTIPDARAAKDDLLRVIDESGEDYLFAKGQFAFVALPQAVKKRILAFERASYQAAAADERRIALDSFAKPCPPLARG